jgi:hypothetical protein
MSPRLEVDPGEHDETQDEPRSRGQGVRAALLALAVAGLVGGSWWAGHRSSPVTQDVSAVPEIHPDAAPVKEPPKDPGGLVVPGQDSVLLNREAKGRPEELLPPAEAVKPRPAPPAPPPQSDTANLSQPVVPPPPANAGRQMASTTPPSQAPSVPPVAEMPPSVAAPKSAAPLAGPIPKVAPLAPAGVTGSYRLQLGALKTEEAAKSAWLKLQRQNSDVLGKLSLSVSRVELGAKGAYYRIQAGPIADETKAAQDCAALKSRKIACILVKP